MAIARNEDSNRSAHPLAAYDEHVLTEGRWYPRTDAEADAGPPLFRVPGGMAVDRTAEAYAEWLVFGLAWEPRSEIEFREVMAAVMARCTPDQRRVLADVTYGMVKQAAATRAGAQASWHRDRRPDEAREHQRRAWRHLRDLARLRDDQPRVVPGSARPVVARPRGRRGTRRRTSSRSSPAGRDPGSEPPPPSGGTERGGVR